MAEGDQSMKKDIHPEYMDTKVICACGNTFTVKSNKAELHVETCNQCHPFYNGTKDALGSSKAGNVEKFRRKYGLNK